MQLDGVFAPVPTPFDDRGQVDVVRMRAAFGRWLASPLSGFVVLGSTGEAALLDDDECDQVAGAARELVPRDRLFIVGTGRESTQAAVAAARRAADLGADAVLVRTPGFFKSQMTTEAFVRHYTSVADSSPAPVLLYNFTAVTGVNLSPLAVSRLAAHPNIVGVKESSGDMAQVADFVNQTPAGFAVLAGSSTTFHAALSVGATGGILALSCIVPDACVRLFDLTRRCRQDEARALQQRLVALSRLVGTIHGVPGLKAALNLVGCDVGLPRPPLLPASDEARAAIGAALASLEEAIA
jgi:4-hydroxy-2-oxoglutarate aldolase